MRHCIYALKDKPANAFMMPFYSMNEATARRALLTTISDPGSMMAKFPDDYSLYLLGHFDDNTGIISSLLEPEFKYSMASLLATKEEN